MFGNVPKSSTISGAYSEITLYILYIYVEKYVKRHAIRQVFPIVSILFFKTIFLNEINNNQSKYFILSLYYLSPPTN